MTRCSHTRAAASFVGLALVAVGVVAFSLVGIAFGLQSLLISTEAAQAAVRCCGTIFSRCLLSPSLARATLPWIGMLVLGYGVLRATVNLARSLGLNHVFLTQLGTQVTPADARLAAAGERLAIGDHLVQLDATGRRAFVAGLWRPTIYVSKDLFASLDDAELDAVLLHEDHHRRSRDPLRAVLIQALEDLLFFLPIGRVLHRTFLEEREHAADEAVDRRGGDRLELAAALCRLARLGSTPGESALVARITGKGQVQQRVERLLGQPVEQRRPPVRSWLLSLALLLVLLGSLYLPVLMTSSPFVFQGCTPEYCRAIGCGTQ